MLYITSSYKVIASQGETPTFFPAVFLQFRNIFVSSSASPLGLLDNHVPECALLVAGSAVSCVEGPRATESVYAPPNAEVL